MIRCFTIDSFFWTSPNSRLRKITFSISIWILQFLKLQLEIGAKPRTKKSSSTWTQVHQPKGRNVLSIILIFWRFYCVRPNFNQIIRSSISYKPASQNLKLSVKREVIKKILKNTTPNHVFWILDHIICGSDNFITKLLQNFWGFLTVWSNFAWIRVFFK